ncbi:MAG: TetR/AcrR family transcriptional regulator [Actinomycetota bacterium]
MSAQPERPGRSAQGAETRNRILEAARTVLAEGGIERFTTRRVAAVAGVSHGMCHYHFKDKRDLLLALIEHARSDWVEPLDRLVDGTGSADVRARAVIAWMAEPATIEVMRVHSALFWFALGDDVVRARLAGEYARWRLPFVTLFREVAAELGLRDFDARGVGEAFASAADGLVQQQSLDPDLPIRQMLASLYERLIDGRRGRGGTGRGGQPSRKRR